MDLEIVSNFKFFLKNFTLMSAFLSGQKFQKLKKPMKTLKMNFGKMARKNNCLTRLPRIFPPI